MTADLVDADYEQGMITIHGRGGALAMSWAPALDRPSRVWSVVLAGTLAKLVRRGQMTQEDAVDVLMGTLSSASAVSAGRRGDA